MRKKDKNLIDYSPTEINNSGVGLRYTPISKE
jgi:hypothetical protein